MALPSYTFDIGTTFKPVGRKHAQVCTITDILKTYNDQGTLVAVRYVATHEFMGQVITDRDVIQTTVIRGLINSTGSTFLECSI